MRPLRILHVLGAMNQGGVETWLMHVLRNIDRSRFRIDFLVHSGEPGGYDRAVLDLGSRIIPCPFTGNLGAYGKRFLEAVRRNGPFDVLHSHVHHFSGVALALGRRAAIPVRIAHSHSDTALAESNSLPLRRVYLALMKRLLQHNCTRGFAVSEAAAEALFGLRWRGHGRIRVLYCGIDPAPFRAPLDPRAVRAEFGFVDDEIVFGHVGRFSPVKNHMFLLEIAVRILERQPKARFLLVGDGSLRALIQHRAGALGIADRVLFPGARSDVPRLMAGAMDALLLPSMREGLPLVLLEAQAAALPAVVSDVVTDEAVFSGDLVRRLPLSLGAEPWARAALERAVQPRWDRRRAVELLEASPFNIARSIGDLCGVYAEAYRSVSERPIRLKTERQWT
jgi:glycosyltransferase involved in cell wall biosynthesis